MIPIFYSQIPEADGTVSDVRWSFRSTLVELQENETDDARDSAPEVIEMKWEM